MSKFTLGHMTLKVAIMLGALGVSALPIMATTAHATSSTQEVAVRNLNQLLTNIKSMSANFSQTTKTNTRQTQFSGEMLVQRQNQFRWETTAPAEQLIVGNGSVLWVYDKDLQQATKQMMGSKVGDTPALLLSGDPAKITQNFIVTQPNSAKNYYVLKPKSSSANFKDLSISFNGGKPVMMVLNDSIGQTTVIKFTNIDLNQKIASSQFNFTPPKGTDIISQ